MPRIRIRLAASDDALAVAAVGLAGFGALTVCMKRVGGTFLPIRLREVPAAFFDDVGAFVFSSTFDFDVVETFGLESTFATRDDTRRLTLCLGLTVVACFSLNEEAAAARAGFRTGRAIRAVSPRKEKLK